jgi:hypothetical protein
MLTIDVLSDDSRENWTAAEMAEENRRILRALNQTAHQAVTDIRKDMPSRFTLRSKWAQKGIRSDNADRDDLTARVYSVDPWMQKQEEGEKYKPKGRHVVIPKGARPSPGSLIPRTMFPNALRARKDVFAFDFSQNPTWKPFPHRGIFQRVMNGKHLRVLYLMKEEKETPARWGFGEQVEDVVDEYFDRYYDELNGFYYDRQTYATKVPDFKW